MPPAQSTPPPFVSVIVPIRNERDFIEPCLRSLLDGTYPRDRMEVLVVDGGSDDGTLDVVQRLASEDSRIRILDNPLRFAATGWNVGIQNARGELLTRVDGHARVAPDFLERSVEALLAHPDAWCAGGPVRTVGTNFIGNVIGAAMSVPVGAGDAAYRLGTIEGYVQTILFGTYHKWVFDRIGLVDPTMTRTEDDDLHIRLRAAGGKMFITPRVQSTHYARGSLRQAARQYYQYGYWRIPVILKHGRPDTVRQIIPLLFVIAWIVLIVAALLWHPAAYALAGFTGLYLLALLAGAVMAIRARGLKAGIATPIVFPVLHFSYGIGSLWSLIRFVILRKPVAGDQGGTSLTR